MSDYNFLNHTNPTSYPWVLVVELEGRVWPTNRQYYQSPTKMAGSIASNPDLWVAPMMDRGPDLEKIDLKN